MSYTIRNRDEDNYVAHDRGIPVEESRDNRPRDLSSRQWVWDKTGRVIGRGEKGELQKWGW